MALLLSFVDLRSFEALLLVLGGIAIAVQLVAFLLVLNVMFDVMLVGRCPGEVGVGVGG